MSKFVIQCKPGMRMPHSGQYLSTNGYWSGDLQKAIVLDHQGSGGRGIAEGWAEYVKVVICIDANKRAAYQRNTTP